MWRIYSLYSRNSSSSESRASSSEENASPSHEGTIPHLVREVFCLLIMFMFMTIHPLRVSLSDSENERVTARDASSSMIPTSGN